MTTKTRKRPKVHEFTSGPWDGVLNASDEPEAYKDKLYQAQNMILPGAETGGGWQLRPSFVLQQAGGVLGTVGGRYGQSIFEHVRLDGTIDRYLFVGGKMYEWNGATPGTYTDITPGAVTISATARIYCLTFANVLIVSDGVNKPWQYDPASTVATVIEYDSVPSAWTAFGKPVVNGGALHFVVDTVAGASLRTDFIWSEPDQPLVGYKQTGFLNTWTLTQTEADPLYALAASNAALYYFRRNSIGAITGVVGPNYQAGATLDSVSTDVGTTTPASVIVSHGSVWFLDETGKPWRFKFGGELEPIWRGLRDAITEDGAVGTLTATLAAASVSVSHPDLPLVLMGIWAAPPSVIAVKKLYVFDALNGGYRGNWDCDGGRFIHTLGVLHDAQQHNSLCVLGDANTQSTPTSGAFLRQHMLSEGSPTWNDANGFTNCFVTTHQLGLRSIGDWLFDLVMVRARANGVTATYNLAYFTPRTTSAPSLNFTMSPVNFIAGSIRALATGIIGVAAAGRTISLVINGLISSAVPSGDYPVFMPDQVTVTAIDGGSDPLAL